MKEEKGRASERNNRDKEYNPRYFPISIMLGGHGSLATLQIQKLHRACMPDITA